MGNESWSCDVWENSNRKRNLRKRIKTKGWIKQRAKRRIRISQRIRLSIITKGRWNKIDGSKFKRHI